MMFVHLRLHVFVDSML